MDTFWQWLWDTDSFMPRAYCGAGWRAEPWLVQLSLWSNIAIFWAYLYLSAGALAMWKLRLRLNLRTATLAYGFILSCGFTHWTQARMFFEPAYHLDVLAQALCAALSMATVADVSLVCGRPVWALARQALAQRRGT